MRKTDVICLGFVVLVAALVVLCGNSEGQGIFENLDVDGLTLTAAEVGQLNAQQKSKGSVLVATQRLGENWVGWIDQNAPIVIQGMVDEGRVNESQRTVLESRITQMRSDLITLLTEYLRQVNATEVSGVTVRRETLGNAVAVSQAIADRAQAKLDGLVFGEADQADIDTQTTVRDSAQSDVNTAQTSLDAFNVAHPE